MPGRKRKAVDDGGGKYWGQSKDSSEEVEVGRLTSKGGRRYDFIAVLGGRGRERHAEILRKKMRGPKRGNSGTKKGKIKSEGLRRLATTADHLGSFPGELEDGLAAGPLLHLPSSRREPTPPCFALLSYGGNKGSGGLVDVLRFSSSPHYNPRTRKPHQPVQDDFLRRADSTKYLPSVKKVKKYGSAVAFVVDTGLVGRSLLKDGGLIISGGWDRPSGAKFSEAQPSNQCYVIGGTSADDPLKCLRLPPLKHARFLAASVIGGGYVYVAGGVGIVNGTVCLLRSIERLKLSRSRHQKFLEGRATTWDWEQVTDLPIPTASPGIAFVHSPRGNDGCSSSLVFAGGSISMDPSHPGSDRSYIIHLPRDLSHPLQWQWRRTDDLTSPRRGHSLFQWPPRPRTGNDTRLVALGGEGEASMSIETTIISSNDTSSLKWRESRTRLTKPAFNSAVIHLRHEL